MSDPLDWRSADSPTMQAVDHAQFPRLYSTKSTNKTPGQEKSMDGGFSVRSPLDPHRYAPEKRRRFSRVFAAQLHAEHIPV